MNIYNCPSELIGTQSNVKSKMFLLCDQERKQNCTIAKTGPAGL